MQPNTALRFHFDCVAGYLEEGFLLLQVFTDHRCHMVRFTVWSQFICSSAPVLFSLILLLQALQHTADLWGETHLVPNTYYHPPPLPVKLNTEPFVGVSNLFRGLIKGH